MATRQRATQSATTYDVVDHARTNRRAIMYPALRSLHRRNLFPHHDSIGTSASEFAASNARYSWRESNPVEFDNRKSVRCRDPCIGLARDFAKRCPQTPFNIRIDSAAESLPPAG